MNKQGLSNFRNVWMQWWHQQGIRMVGGPREAPTNRLRKRDKFMGFFRKTKVKGNIADGGENIADGGEVEQPPLPGNFLPTAPNPALLERPNGHVDGESHTMINRIRLVLKKVEESEAQTAAEIRLGIADPPSRSSSFPGDVGPGNTTTAVSIVSAGTT